ncbi:MAG: DUF1778 domain-containing protein [Cyanobacteria bacterium P01_F01_bin.143]
MSEAKTNPTDLRVLVLSDRDRDLFLSIIANPPKPKQDLIKAMRDFKKNMKNRRQF